MHNYYVLIKNKTKGGNKALAFQKRKDLAYNNPKIPRIWIIIMTCFAENKSLLFTKTSNRFKMWQYEVIMLSTIFWKWMTAWDSDSLGWSPDECMMGGWERTQQIRWPLFPPTIPSTQNDFLSAIHGFVTPFI